MNVPSAEGGVAPGTVTNVNVDGKVAINFDCAQVRKTTRRDKTRRESIHSHRARTTCAEHPSPHFFCLFSIVSRCLLTITHLHSLTRLVTVKKKITTRAAYILPQRKPPSLERPSRNVYRVLYNQTFTNE